LLLEALLHGEPDCSEGWRYRLKIPGILVTDAKSLYDHLHKTGSVPSERQTLIDLLIAKDLQEAAAIIVKWVPTTYQLADVLTKAMPVPPVMALLLEKVCARSCRLRRMPKLKHAVLSCDMTNVSVANSVPKPCKLRLRSADQRTLPLARSEHFGLLPMLLLGRCLCSN
jgi:hypothetical protein